MSLEKIVASIMCADPLNLSQELTDLAAAGVDWLHCDVMDGKFVNNLAMGPYVLEPLIQNGNFTTDIHLACENPRKYIEMFAKLQPDYITFHLEAAENINVLIKQIHSYGIKAGVAISPQTPLEELYPYIEELDLILMMTVQPGFAGQAFDWSVLAKLQELNEHLKLVENQPLIEVDGNINKQTIKEISPIGANLYVVGTSALFNQEAGSYLEKVQRAEASFRTKKGG